MMRWAILLLVLLSPTALAAESLSDLEEPHKGTDKVWDVTVTNAEANARRVLIYRNEVGHGFGLIIYDSTGAEIFVKNGTRGLQTLPELAAGEYKFFVRGAGEFQVTDKAFERIIKENNVSTTLRGTDAYVLSPSRYWKVDFTGDVTVEWWALTEKAESLTSPVNRTAQAGQGYVMTLRGAEGTPYTISMTPTDAPVTESPSIGLVALLAGVVGVALAARFTRRT